MTTSQEARRVCLTHEPREAADTLQRCGVDPERLARLLRAPTGARERHRREVVELLDGWGRPTEMAVYVPESTESAPPGVIVGLHGVGGSGVELEPQLRPLADACGAVLLCPTAQQPVVERSNFELAGLFGRRFRQTRWTTDAGDYPVRALVWARTQLDIDFSRCALVGASMGGIATWGIAARRWDGLSMAVSINGAPSIWERFGPDRTSRELLPNLLNLPFTVVHGRRDEQIPAVLDREAVAQLRQLGHRRLSFIEVPDGEHRLSTMRFTPDSLPFEAVVRCYRSARRSPWPVQVQHRARDRESGRAHWVAVDDVAPGRTASVAASVSRRSRLDITAAGTARLRLFLSDRLVAPGRVLVTVNGTPKAVDFVPSIMDTVTSYVESGADPDRTAQMVVDVDVPESCE